MDYGFGLAPRGSGFLVGFLAFLVFALALTLALVWSDFQWNWGILRKSYPGEECETGEDCLDGLVCQSGSCGCASTSNESS